MDIKRVAKITYENWRKQEILSDTWHLKQRISGDWNKIDQQLIDSAVKQWRKYLAACVSARGGHLEHMLKAEL